MPGVPPARFGFLGPAGTFTEAALRTLPAAARADLRPYASVAEALDAVRAGDLDGAVVPLENSVEGSVATTLDELASGEPLQVTREVLLPVSFALLARPGTGLHEVRTVATHPHAEAQCRRWLRQVLPEASVVPAPSTADGAREVAAGRHDAALAAPVAAGHYGLEVLADDVHDRDGAVTRFVLVSRPGPPPAPTGADRTTLFAFIADDHPGALLELLTEFAVRGVNLTRIESRPTGDRLGRYFFSVDCEGHLADARVGEALSALRRVCADVRVLGSYPRADGVAPAVRPGTSDDDFRASAAWLARLRDGPPD
ncbi:MAG TPA: prephenate dehydratase [Mycobacteriales bacterium]|nr:prephenate dehydratase [Mycobacteriales bacterium]